MAQYVRRATGTVSSTLTLALATALWPGAQLAAQDPPYTYQGILNTNGAPATRPHTFQFLLYDASSNGTQIGPAGPVTGPTPPDPFGRFNVTPRDPWALWGNTICWAAQPWPPISEGDWPSQWQPVYLEVGVKGPDDMDFTALSPRQELTPAPLAIAAVLAGRAESLKLPFSASIEQAFPGMEITQNGEGPAARFKVQPQPEPPSPSPAVEAISVTSAPAILASNTVGPAGVFEGDVHLTGSLTRAYASGTASLATPIAYAFINSDGTMASGTPNVSSDGDAANGRYLITIAGETYSATGYATMVTARVAGTAPPRLVSTSAVSGQLIVRLYDVSGAAVQNSFQFVTYKP